MRNGMWWMFIIPALLWILLAVGLFSFVNDWVDMAQLWAADKLNISAAGRELGMAPAVASARFAKLEKSLSAELLHRSTRKVSLQMKSKLMKTLSRGSGETVSITRVDLELIQDLQTKKSEYTETSFEEIILNQKR